MSSGTLRRSIKRLLSLTSSDTSTLVPDNGSEAAARIHKILVVGLGNYPAPRSRHSVGQYLLQCVAERHQVKLSYQKSCKAHMASFHLDNTEIHLLKPKYFMNLSGKSVVKAVKQLEVCPSNVMLLHDELDLPLGRFKLKNGGSANGHNGVIDTQERLRFSDFKRLRIGIGRPESKEEVVDYVLSDFTRDEKALLAAMKETLVDTVEQTLSIMVKPPGTATDPTRIPSSPPANPPASR